ncbi:MAG: hypothetical protein ABIP94_14185, partial [Planctomycetota bacterium]
ATQAATEGLKVRLKEDLFDHLGTEILLMQDADAAAAGALEADPDDPTAAISGMCFGISLRDGKAFSEALETALRSRGLHASRKSEDYADTKVYSMKIAAMLDIEYAVTDDLLLLAIGKGEASRRHLRGVLDARAAKSETDSLPTAAQAHMEHLPAGWNGISVVNMAATLRSYRKVIDMMKSMEAEIPPEVSMVLDVLTSVGSDLQRLGMQSMVSGSYTSARKLAARLRW